MRIGNRRHGAMHDRHAAELAGGQHRAFDVNVGIDKSRQNKRARCAGGFLDSLDSPIRNVDRAGKHVLAQHIDNLA